MELEFEFKDAKSGVDRDGTPYVEWRLRIPTPNELLHQEVIKHSRKVGRTSLRIKVLN